MSKLFGSVRQNGYVVRDIHATMKHWITIAGVGPWFYVDRVETEYFRHRGAPASVEMSVALANSGELQIELIQQRNDAPSLYQEFLNSGREGFQHIAYWTTDFPALYDRALAAGLTVGHEGQIGGPQGRFAYFDTELHQGTIIEISDISGPKGKFFDHIRRASINWDGTNPIRSI
jgi:hypothetical protein